MRIRTALLYVAIIIGTVFVVEILARAYAWSPSRDHYEADRLGQWRYYHSAEGFGDLMPNQDGHWVIWFHRPYHVQTNSVGLRNTAELSNTAFRILAIGDSQTFGAYNANEDTWPAWTENGLNLGVKQAGRFQVLNAGVSSYTISDELAYLKEKGVALQPRLVVLAVFENDVLDLRKDQAGATYRPKGSPLSLLQTTLRAIGRSSALVGLAEQVKTEMEFKAAGVDIRRGEGETRPPSEAPREEVALEKRYAELFRETAALLKDKSIPFAVFYIPSAEALDGGPRPTVEPVVRRLTEESGTPYLDLTPVLQRQPDPAQRLYLMQKDPKTGQLTGNGHLSREGHAAVAEAVVQWLANSKLVPTP